MWSLPHWQEITNDPTILQCVKGIKIEFKPGVIPFQANVRPSTFSQSQHDIVAVEIDKLCQKGVLKVSSPEPGEFVSPIFLRPKPDGSHRMILNLKPFNEFVQYHHFKMDTLESAIKMMKPGCYMASIDLKDAYYSVPVAKEHQKYLKFVFNGTLYQYTCLPNGLSSAPRIFTKLLKPVYACLHTLGHLNLGYIDDSYLQGDSAKECSSNIKATALLFNHLGFHLHPTNSVIIPTQTLTFLGFRLDSLSMTVSPTGEKILKTVEACKRLQNMTKPLISEVAEVIGLIVSNFPGVQFGPLHYRFLERDKTHALITNKGNYKSHMTLTSSSVAELTWWIENMPHSSRDITHPTPFMIIQTDASTLGWGAVYGDQEVGGRWTSLESTSHINILELQAAFFALKSFCKETIKGHVQLQIDNTTAVAYINNMGGSKSPKLNSLAQEIWDWCIQRQLWVSATHIAGKLNVSADSKSRKFQDKHEWMLNKDAFKVILSLYPELNIDLFATRLNNQLALYCSWKPDPGCAFVDALTIDWRKFNFYAFPPFSLIPRCLQKIAQDQAKGILIIPVWPTQTWFSQALQLLCNQPWIMKPSKSLLQHASQHVHPLHNKLHLMVCPLSGNPLHYQDPHGLLESGHTKTIQNIHWKMVGILSSKRHYLQFTKDKWVLGLPHDPLQSGPELLH